MILQDISLQLQAGKAKLVKELVQSAIDQGLAPEVILNDGLLAGMDVIGKKFKEGTIFVPEVVTSPFFNNSLISKTLLSKYLLIYNHRHFYIISIMTRNITKNILRI